MADTTPAKSAVDMLTEQELEALIESWGGDCVTWIMDQLKEEELCLEPSSGLVGEEAFKKWLSLLGAATELADLLWSACDMDRTGKVTVFELATFCATLARGSPEQRADLSFRLCDRHRNGVLRPEDLKHACQAILAALDSVVGENADMATHKVDDFVETLLFHLCIDSDAAAGGSAEVTQVQWRKGFCDNGEKSTAVRAFARSLGAPEGEPDSALQHPSQVALHHIFGPQCKFALRVMLVLELTAQRAAADMPIGIEGADISSAAREEFSETSTLELPLNVELRTPDNTMKVVAWAPKVFRRIRIHDGISDLDFSASVGVHQFYGSLLLGELTSMTNSVSEAKSGSLFFVTPDKQFFVKTIRASEKKQMLQMLSSYTEYLSRNPKSLITRFLGLYTIQRPDTKDVHVLVMRNLFADAAPSARFDIKGCLARDDVTGAGLFGDTDWVNKDEDLGLDEDLRQELCEMMRKDADFLSSHNLMDYSLLIGFSDACEERDPALVAAENLTGTSTVKNSTSWLQLSSQPPGASSRVVSIGIIDTLTVYNFSKMAETKIKSKLAGGKDIVCIDSAAFCERFKNFMQRQVCKTSNGRSDVGLTGNGVPSQEVENSSQPGEDTPKEPVEIVSRKKKPPAKTGFWSAFKSAANKQKTEKSGEPTRV